MAELLRGQTANDLWSEAFNLLKTKGNSVPSRNGETKEVLHVLLELTNPQEKWVYKRMPPISVAFALVEVMWIVNGRNDAKIIDFWNARYKDTAADPNRDTYHGAYGFRLRTQHCIDQIERAYQALLANPENRQTVMIIWDAEIDMPNWDGTSQSNDIPCNICSLLKIRDGHLDWTQIMRSNDLVLGLPYNIIQFTSFQEIMAGWLGVKVGNYIHFSDSLHIYDKYEYLENIGFLSELDDIVNCDSLSIDKPSFDKISKEIIRRMGLMVDFSPLSDATARKKQEKELREIATLDSEYQAYNNMLFIIGAKAALKLTLNKLAQELIKCCNNPIYTKLIELKASEMESRG